MQNIVLSICIPTFNRSERVESLVKSILEYNGKDIEVVALDNASTDDTVKRLKEINDVRFNLYTNTENITAVENWIKVLTLGKGKYLLHCNDRDLLSINELPEILNLLRDDEFSFVWCRRESRNYKLETFRKGIHSLKQISFSGYHPTGLIFNKELLSEINTNFYSKFDIVNVLPHNFIIFDICFFGKTAFYYSEFWNYAENGYIKKHSSGFQPGNKALWYEPVARMEQLIKQTNHILGCNKLDVHDRNELIYLAFKKVLTAAIIEYRFYSVNEEQCSHYGTTPRKYHIFELDIIMIKFIKEYIRFIRNHRCITWKFYIIILFTILGINYKRLRIFVSELF